MKVPPRSHLKPWPLEPQSMAVFGNKVPVALVSWDEVMLEQSRPYKWNGGEMDMLEGYHGKMKVEVDDSSTRQESSVHADGGQTGQNSLHSLGRNILPYLHPAQPRQMYCWSPFVFLCLCSYKVAPGKWLYSPSHLYWRLSNCPMIAQAKWQRVIFHLYDPGPLLWVWLLS